MRQVLGVSAKAFYKKSWIGSINETYCEECLIKHFEESVS